MARNDRRLSAVEARLARISVPQKIVDRFGRYRDDPVGFCQDILGFESATRRSDGEPYQYSILSDLAQHERVVIRSGHGIGKSALVGAGVCWWLLTRPMSKVVIVAPQFGRQVVGVAFAEIKKRVRQSRVPLPLRLMAHRVEVEGYGATWGAVGLPATEPDRIEGQHSQGGTLLILDECKGISQAVVDALEGTQTGPDVRVLVCSTPGGPGAFYRIWAHGGSAWSRHHVPSTDSSLVRAKWIEDRRREWGEASPIFQARVMGEFPDAGEGVLLPLHLLEAAQRDAEPAADAITTLGIDVSRSIAGDLNAVAVVRGGVLLRIETWRDPDLMGTVQRVVQTVATSGASRIVCDVGGVGAGAVDRLRQLGLAVEAVAFGGRAADAQRFVNKRAEMGWILREQLERGLIVLPDDDDLIADLSSLRFQFAGDGRIILEPKADTVKRLGHSPDRADALMMAAGPDAMPVDLDEMLAGWASGLSGMMKTSIGQEMGDHRWPGGGGFSTLEQARSAENDPGGAGSLPVAPGWPSP
jgi:hypothetical protein